jgi:hypothetical protein
MGERTGRGNLWETEDGFLSRLYGLRHNRKKLDEAMAEDIRK